MLALLGGRLVLMVLINKWIDLGVPHIGYRVNSVRTTQFRQLSTYVLCQFAIADYMSLFQKLV